MVNVAFMPPCAVVVEAFPCGLPLPFYGHLAWNTGKIYLPVHPASCAAAAAAAAAAATTAATRAAASSAHSSLGPRSNASAKEMFAAAATASYMASTRSPRAALECVDHYQCRRRVREQPVRLTAEEVLALLRVALPMRSRCLGKLEEIRAARDERSSAGTQ